MAAEWPRDPRRPPDLAVIEPTGQRCIRLTSGTEAIKLLHCRPVAHQPWDKMAALHLPQGPHWYVRHAPVCQKMFKRGLCKWGNLNDTLARQRDARTGCTIEPGAEPI